MSVLVQLLYVSNARVLVLKIDCSVILTIRLKSECFSIFLLHIWKVSVLVYLLYDVTIYIHKVSVLVYFYYVSKRSVLVHLQYGFTIEGTFENFMRTPTVGCIFFLRSLHFCLCANFYAHPDSGLRSELSKTLLSAFEVSLRLESKALATTFTYTL